MTALLVRSLLVSALLFCSLGAHSASSMSEAQAKSYFATARLSAQGTLDAVSHTAVLIPNSDSTTARLELWRKTSTAFELTASAPFAGCFDCSGPTHKPNPSALSIASGLLEVEYQGGGSGLGFWAWRTSWSWDPTLSKLRSVSTQRIGSDALGAARHVTVNFIAGTRTARVMDDTDIKSTRCRAAVNHAPAFSQLALRTLFNGTLEPDCQSGTESGNALAASSAPGSGALDNMMRASSPALR